MCNCPSVSCPVHPNALCSNPVTDEACECGEYHGHGNGIFGEGISLCQACADHAIAILINGTQRVMVIIQHSIPPHMEAINDCLADLWKYRRKDGPWATIIQDVRGLMQFVALIIPNLNSAERGVVAVHAHKLHTLLSPYKEAGSTVLDDIINQIEGVK